MGLHSAGAEGLVFDRERDGRIAITGGAGFIGTHLADRLMRDGHDVVILDNYSCAGAEANARDLAARHGTRLRVRRGDVRDRMFVHMSLRDAAAVFHLAAQDAVQASVVAPRSDFEVNVCGTFNVLEALRQMDAPPPLVFASTSQVYGELRDVTLSAHGGRWEPDTARMRERGIDESRLLEFHMPYACSKGAADQYVLDFARVFGLPAIVFRMSSIYGPRQTGETDHGWIAHALLEALRGDPVTIPGDGRQVSDVLFVDDLVEALLAAWRAPAAHGRAFNVGGGPERTLSTNELLAMLAGFVDTPVVPRHAAWRPGEPRCYASDTGALRAATGWQPRIGVDEGVRRLYHWLASTAVEGVPVD